MKTFHYVSNLTLGSSGAAILLPQGFGYRLLGGNIHYAATATAGSRAPRIEAHDLGSRIVLANAAIGSLSPSASVNFIMMPGAAYRDDVSSLDPYNVILLGWPNDFIFMNGWSILFQDINKIDLNDSIGWSLLFERIDLD